ncbi:MAG: type I-E CRISPR-associated protein Cas6/Cse3/CasE [Butyricicoccus pullicaecorum]|nr:type I-E CRISPR-associated protein Cas6/Cse3/CasE [Butyricicoccus pullicaecorum]
MYLSRVALDIHKRSTMTALANPQQFHGAVEQAFAGERRRRLWRLDQLGERRYLLLLSEDMPDLKHIAKQFGTGELPETKDYTPLLDRIQSGTVWRFRLTANPTKSVPNQKNPAKRGKVYAHITTEFQQKWLLERAQKHGFQLNPDAFTVVQSQWRHFQKKYHGQAVSLLAVTYEGVLEVTDAQAFRKLLTEGIGRGKAYGLGLMTVIGR